MKFEVRWMEEKRIFIEANDDIDAYNKFISNWAGKKLPEGELINVSANSVKVKEVEVD